MSIQDHINRAEEFIEMFPVLRDAVDEYIEEGVALTAGYEGKDEDDLPKNIRQELDDLSAQFESMTRAILLAYTATLPLDELKWRLARLQEFSQLTGFLFWQPTYYFLVHEATRIIYKQLGSLGGKSTVARHGKEHMQKISRSRQKPK